MIWYETPCEPSGQSPTSNSSQKYSVSPNSEHVDSSEKEKRSPRSSKSLRSWIIVYVASFWFAACSTPSLRMNVFVGM